MEPGRKLPAAVILVVLGGSLMLVGGYWFGALLIASGFIGLLVTYQRGGSRSPAGARLNREWTHREAVLRALTVSGCGPLTLLIMTVLDGDTSWTRVAVALGAWVVLFPLMLLSVWGKVRPR